MAPERDTPRIGPSRTGFDPGGTPDPALSLDRESALLDDADDRADRSNITAFFLGGVMLVGGLLAFLYYDGDGADRDVPFTGSLAPIEGPATSGSLLQPNRTSPPSPRP